jgi:hypothetical protein
MPTPLAMQSLAMTDPEEQTRTALSVLERKVIKAPADGVITKPPTPRPGSVCERRRFRCFQRRETGS